MKLYSVLVAVVIGASASTLFAAAPEANVFGLTKQHAVQLTLSAAEYAAMEPPPTAGPFGGGSARPAPGGPVPGRPSPGSPDFGAGNFGFEFEYVKGHVQVDGATFKDIGVRYKGSGTYAMSQRQTKRSLKIDFDRYDDAQAWHGEKKINLNSGVMDPTKAREALAYAVFHAAGVPAPRTALAEVTLTVPGKFDAEYLGVFTLVEQVDKAFLKAHFKSSQGLLLKPEGIRGLPYFGEEGAVYDASYISKNSATPEQWARLVGLTRLINRADEETFRREIASYLDTTMFAKFLSVNTMLASMDGFIGMGHNYYLYLDPQSNKFVFIPWDLDLAFGAFPMFGTPQQLVDLSIDHPHLGENKLIDRLLAMPDFKAAYREELKKLVTEVFTAEKLGAQIRAIEETLQPLLAKDKAAAVARKEGGGAGGPGGMFGGTPISLAEFVQQRAASVKAQLAGERHGYVPTPGMGFGGPPGGFAVGPQLSKPLLDALDANKDGEVSTEEFTSGMQRFARDWDQNKNGALTQRELGEGIQRLMPTPRGPGAGPGR